MFVGRERELKALKDVYDKNGFGMTIIYGRRRVGKSTLIKKFRERNTWCIRLIPDSDGYLVGRGADHR